ncbi:hypothetical protein Poly24_33370 [Rosistilla carotiformis]|uniref:IncA protein n=1 Tax=Rosistilla carotiformis TaxID=2528017 RepID=A0A518JVQ8_9BACT|nr:hypothetical protein [Rosistilla carotiformis]QDV69621.1 hypothetical protein Poly24_33370 [Rosistilla carotiformis]
MARRPRTNDDEISLFPFLSIVACVIGVLTMMIATLALAQTDSPDIAQIEEYESVQKKQKEADESIQQLQQRISVSNSAALHLKETQKERKLTQAELEALLQETEELEKQLAEQKKLEVVIPKVNPKDRETIGDMQTQLSSVQEQLAQLEAQLKKREDVPTEGNVTILPQGSGATFVPHFVECADGSLVLHNLPEPKRVRTSEAGGDKDFKDLMNKVLNGKDDTIIFLVRSDGLSTYRTLKSLCDSNDVRNGKIPVVGKGRIDLSVFTEKQTKAK